MVGRVHEVIVENFKSYEGRVRVGPFRKFTCVIGPNGAGKSNLMDAISFVLGVRTRHLRGDRLQELIHRKEGETVEGNQRTAAVELVYASDGPSGAAAAGGLEATTVFRRVIQPAGEARFQVNGEPVSQAVYLKHLQGVNILSEARNFLVFQGDVEAAAHRRGKDLTHFFEQVSGSIAFREDYDRLAAEKAQKEDLARCLYTRRRNAANEKKRVAQQKEEAERYQALAAEHQRLQVEFYLFRFHELACREEEVAHAQASAQEECRELRALAEQRRVELTAADRSHTEARKALEQAEQFAGMARGKLEASNPEGIQVRSQLSVLEDRLQELRLHAQRDARRREQLEQQATALREEREALQAELEGLAAKVHKELPFTPAQREEFEQAQRAMELKASDAAGLRELGARLRAVAGDRQQLEQEGRAVRARCVELQRRLQDLEETEVEAAATQQRFEEAARKQGGRLEELEREGQDHSQERAQLEAERRQILREIQDITATERQIGQERRLKQVAADLVQLVPGVHGRILDLCTPLPRRYRVAVNVALGGYVDAVVTDTAEGARKCVQHLKDRMLDPLTFLPLDNLRVPPPDAQLQEALQGRRELRAALDCISFNNKLGRVFRFLLGDVVVADELEVGRRFAFEELRARGTGCRLVTVDGETISRDGNLSVSSDAAREGATRFDFAALEVTRSRLETIDRRLCELRAMGLGSSTGGAEVQEQACLLLAQAREGQRALQRFREERTARQEELRGLEALAGERHAQAERLAAEEAQLREELASTEERVAQEASEPFVRLSAEMGVDDVRRLAREWRQERDEAQARECEARERAEAAVRELALLEQALHEQDARGASRAAAECEQEIGSLRQRQARIAQQSEVLGSEVETLGEQLAQLRSLERAAERGAAQARAQLSEERRRVAETERRLAGLAAELQTLRGHRAELLRQSVLEDVEIPLADSMEVLQGAADAAAGGAAPAVAAVVEETAAGRPADLAIDLSSLPDEKRRVKSGPSVRLLEDEYRSELHKMAGELERLRPNLKAIEQLRRIAEQAESAAQDAMAAKHDIEDVDKRFEAVRRKRRDCFMACFQRVQEEINVVYNRLTGDPTGRAGALEGGSAYLDLEDQEDPFNGGVKFTAMPPMKRFSDIALLSGGERTLAAMALLFAMQAFQRPPFLVLDEVDAHLDGPNVQALARYVEESSCQTIVISLKDKLFASSDGLVGVSRDRHAQSSITLTWDLAQFRLPRPGAPPTPAPAPAAEADDVEMVDAKA